MMDNSDKSRPDLLSADQLEVNEESGTHLKDAGIWAKTIAISASIFCVFIILILLTLGDFFLGAKQLNGRYLTGAIISMLIASGLASVFIINLFRFSNGMATGITNQDNAAFEKGITGLRNYFIFIGVCTLLLSLIYVVGLIS